MREACLSFFQSKLMTPLAMFLSVMVALVGCGCQEKISSDKKLHFYIVLAPISEEAIKTSNAFLINAKENVIDKTQIIFPGPNYTVAGLCEGDNPEIWSSMIAFSDGNGIGSVTGGVEKSLGEVVSKNKKCTATSQSLVNLSKNLNDAASKPEKGELVVLIQVPWQREEISDDVWKKLQESMTKLAQNKNVKRVVLFGVSPNGSDRLGQAFQAFNKTEHKFDSRTTGQIQEELKAIRQDILQLQCKK